MKIALCVATILLGLGAADDATAAEPRVYDWPSESVPVLVEDDSGVLFVGKDRSVYRVYDWKQSKGEKSDGLYLIDLDKDGKPEVVGAGKPTFVLDVDGDPVWFRKQGCDQVLIADVAVDEKLDLVCVDGTKVEVFTHDGQKAFEVSIGKRFEWCHAGDINGDLKADVECKIRGKNAYTRIDVAGQSVLAAEADASEVNPKELEEFAPAGAEISKDLDGDGKAEKVAIDGKDIVVTPGEGGEAARFPVNAKKYKRTPVAELRSVYANNFEDDAAAQKAVNVLQGKLDNCYAGPVRKNQFAGSGQVLFEVHVGPDGKLQQVKQLHSEIADASVAKCALGVLKKGDYPKANGDAAKINVMLFYTFRDK